ATPDRGRQTGFARRHTLAGPGRRSGTFGLAFSDRANRPVARTGRVAGPEETVISQQPGQVLIVGAGPAGMALAYLLARRGVGVTVLEQHHDFARAFRGETLQKSGIDAFRQMGLGEQFDRVPHTEMQSI